MKLSQLRAFIAVVDTSSFSEAGLELGVSQAAISHAIGELEGDLGIKLLERDVLGEHPCSCRLRGKSKSGTIARAKSGSFHRAIYPLCLFAKGVRIEIKFETKSSSSRNLKEKHHGKQGEPKTVVKRIDCSAKVERRIFPLYSR